MLLRASAECLSFLLCYQLSLEARVKSLAWLWSVCLALFFTYGVWAHDAWHICAGTP